MSIPSNSILRALLAMAAASLSACGGGGDNGDSGGGTGPGNPPVMVTVNLGDDRLLEEGSDGGTTVIEFEVTLDTAATDVVTVEYSTAHETTEGNDLDLASGIVRFAPGDTTATIAIEAVADDVFELNEDFSVQLANPSSNTTIGDGEAIGRLINDDPLLVVFDLVFLGYFDRTIGGISVPRPTMTSFPRFQRSRLRRIAAALRCLLRVGRARAVPRRIRHGPHLGDRHQPRRKPPVCAA